MNEPTRRTQPRVPVQIPVVIEHGALFLDAIAVNLGLGGVFVETHAPLDYGTSVSVVVQLPGLTRTSRLVGVVRWSNTSGCGIQFLQLGASETYAISSMRARAVKRGTAA